MIRNYIRIALRNLWKNKFMSVVNILGLSVGLSAALVIWMIVHYDLSFDTFHKDRDRMYRVVSKLDFNKMIIKTSGVPIPMLPELRANVPGVEKAALIYQYSPNVKIKEQKFGVQKRIAFAEPEYFSLIDYKWIYGSPAVLKNPLQTVLTEERAAQYFPGTALQDVIGREVTYDDSIRVAVSGIVQSLKGNTDFTFQEFVSMQTVLSDQGLKKMRGWDAWNNFNSGISMFVKLRPGVEKEKIEARIMGITKAHDDEDSKNQYTLQPLREIHFNSEIGAFDQRQANLPVLYKLGALVVFLLLLGCINFVNLQTAQAGERAKEIGIRKSLGSSKGRVILQFLGESFVLTAFAAALSVLMVPGILSAFNSFIPDGVTMAMFAEWQIFLFIPILVLLVGLMAGIYPSFVLARFQPVAVLKNQVHGIKGKARLRQVLTISQFSIALVLIMATVIVGEQTKYAYRKDLGFDKEARFFLKAPGSRATTEALKAKLDAFPEVEMLSYGYSAPLSLGTSSTTMSLGTGEMAEKAMVEAKYIDANYVPFYKIKLLAGRNILPSDTAREMLINESYARAAGFAKPEDAIGQLLSFNDKKKPVVGVVADFHTKGMQTEIMPLALTSDWLAKTSLHVSLHRDADVHRTMDKIKAAWNEVFPNDEFKATYVDDALEIFYQSEKRLNQLLSWATGVAIFISCLGLLGLAIYATRQRTKEIGIRKVLGASVGSIVMLFSKDVTKLICIAAFIATGIAWYAMDSWLQNFAYHINIPWWVFPLAAAAALLLGLVTVASQAFKAAMVNPVRSLKSE
ncbi:ABC transporter permease [Chitinophaga barathri]|uniref:FtsX-like permease family protein n=1 Tax=Chitinophaga barathri TaxID=1647451 RepID=A0A3N4MXS2_9BACT|nr:ABC transporter permease [Chitinophaga barathri]RPD40203.1 FtsX-like permease family protein [Chitinophaga barathri]